MLILYHVNVTFGCKSQSLDSLRRFESYNCISSQQQLGMTKAQSAMHSFDSTGTSTTTRTTASSEEPVSRPLLLTCIRVLRLHFEHGGLDQTGYDVLYRMIQMMPATGWETHVAITSSAPPGDCSTKMERYAGCIPQGCQMSSHNMQIAAEKALQAVKSLPELNGNVRVYREWARTLR